MCQADGYEAFNPGLYPWTARPHHIIPRQYLIRGGQKDKLWDVRNKLDLCGYHHGQHENAQQRVPKSLLPPEAFEFAKELHLEWVIDRYYA